MSKFLQFRANEEGKIRRKVLEVQPCEKLPKHEVPAVWGKGERVREMLLGNNISV